MGTQQRRRSYRFNGQNISSAFQKSGWLQCLPYFIDVNFQNIINTNLMTGTRYDDSCSMIDRSPTNPFNWVSNLLSFHLYLFSLCNWMNLHACRYIYMICTVESVYGSTMKVPFFSLYRSELCTIDYGNIHELIIVMIRNNVGSRTASRRHYFHFIYHYSFIWFDESTPDIGSVPSEGKYSQ